MLSLSLKPTYSNRYIIRLSVSLSTAHPPTRKRLLFFCHHTPTPMNTKPFFLSLSLLHIHTHFLYLFALHSYCNVNKCSYTILSHDCSCARYWRKSATHNWPVLNAFHVVSHSLSLSFFLCLYLWSNVWVQSATIRVSTRVVEGQFGDSKLKAEKITFVQSIDRSTSAEKGAHLCFKVCL